MSKEGIEPVEFDEDLLLTPDVRDMMEMEVQATHLFLLLTPTARYYLLTVVFWQCCGFSCGPGRILVWKLE